MTDPIFDARACRGCGCTDERACPPTCWWVEEDLCSSCALRAEGAQAVLDVIEELHRSWYEAGGKRYDNTVLVTGKDVPADHVCRIGPGLERCVIYAGHPDETEHQVAACSECRHYTEDGEPGLLLYPCPTLRAARIAASQEGAKL